MASSTYSLVGDVGDNEPLLVFVSAAEPDRGWARWIGQELRRAGHTVEYADASWRSGTISQRGAAAVTHGADGADKVVVVVSAAYLDPALLGYDERALTARQARRRRGALVPVLVAPSPSPGWWSEFSPVSFVELGRDEARDQLLARVRQRVPSGAGAGAGEDVPWPGDEPSAEPGTHIQTPDRAGATTDRRPGLDPQPEPARKTDWIARRAAAGLPRYEIGQRLGSGTFGVVLAARYRPLNRPTAVKVLSADHEGSAERFGSEAQLLAGLDSHAHVVRIYDYDEHDGTYMIMMELLTGGTLTRRRSGMTQLDACAVGLAVAEALFHMHERGVLHRDVKPDNMIFDSDGLLKVTDFGIAKIFDGPDGHATASAIVGTPKYMAPEQITRKKLGPPTDVYALGAVLYELLAAEPVFGADLSTAQLYRSHLEAVPPPPRGVPAPVAAVVMRTLEKDPANRYQSAREFACELAAAAVSSFGEDWLDRSSVKARLSDEVHAIARPVLRPPPPLPPPPPRPHRGRRALVAGLVAAGVAAALGPLGPLWPQSPEPGAVLGGCDYVSVVTGQVGSPYHRYGTALAKRIQQDYPGTTAVAQSTTGSAFNLESVRTPTAARCVLSIVQFTTAVDARFGVLQFEGSAIDDLHSVGPVWFDLLQLVVREDSAFAVAPDLCGATVATGLRQSGTFQIGEVLFRQVTREAETSGRPGCEPNLRPSTLADGLAGLRDGTVDAVLWAGGSPTQQIQDAVGGGLPVRLLRLDGYLEAMQSEWDAFYGGRLGASFVDGPVYGVQTIEPGDYGDTAPVATVAVPNGLVVNNQADSALVGYVTRALFEHRAELEAELWGTDPADVAGRTFLDVPESVGTNPVYCLVPLHPAAAEYYQSIGVAPPCA